MYVEIDQAWTDNKARDVHALGIGRGLPGRIRADRRDFSVGNENVGCLIEAIGRIDDVSADEEQRIHFEGSVPCLARSSRLVSSAVIELDPRIAAFELTTSLVRLGSSPACGGSSMVKLQASKL